MPAVSTNGFPRSADLFSSLEDRYDRCVFLMGAE